MKHLMGSTSHRSPRSPHPPSAAGRRRVSRLTGEEQSGTRAGPTCQDGPRSHPAPRGAPARRVGDHCHVHVPVPGTSLEPGENQESAVPLTTSTRRGVADLIPVTIRHRNIPTDVALPSSLPLAEILPAVAARLPADRRGRHPQLGGDVAQPAAVGQARGDHRAPGRPQAPGLAIANDQAAERVGRRRARRGHEPAGGAIGHIHAPQPAPVRNRGLRHPHPGRGRRHRHPRLHQHPELLTNPPRPHHPMHNQPRPFQRNKTSPGALHRPPETAS